ncbi:MAG: universal stress protein [Actinobacteria bacterium]|nr:MAG: universal stress protein [Actinomycetota bacterium]TMM13981.1 MAG: universal stress protein [Actinomycetota bacterium]
MTAVPHRILVVANETVGGRALIDAVKTHAQEAHERGEPFHVTVICPQNQPRSGYVIYEDSVRAAAENRLRQTLAQLREVGIEADGEVMDPDPFSATMDAIDAYGADQVIISTHPDTRSGWLRRDLVDRVRDASGLPVEHVVVDLEADRAHVTRTLVVANQTVGGQPLLDLLKRKGFESPHNFVVILPQGEGGEHGDAHNRLAHTLQMLHDAGLEAIGQVMDPDPFTAVQNALQFYPADEIVISTFPETRSGWLRSDLIERVKTSTSKPVEHVVVDVAPVEAEA